MKKRSKKHARARVHKKQARRPALSKKLRAKLSKKGRRFISKKIAQLKREGYPKKQAIAIAFKEWRKRGGKAPAPRNPIESRPHKAGKAVRRGAIAAGRAAKRGARAAASAARDFYRGLVSKDNPRDKFGRYVVVFDQAHNKWAVGTHNEHTARVTLSSWWASRKDAVRRAKELARAAKRVRGNNPLSGVIAAMGNPMPGHRVGDKVKWKDAPASVRRSKKAQKAVRLAARTHGIPMGEVEGEVCRSTDGAPPHTVSSGELVSFDYETPAGTKRARTKSGLRIRWNHKSGDHGRGKKKTRRLLLTTDPDTRLPILVARKGSRPGFSSTRGHTG